MVSMIYYNNDNLLIRSMKEADGDVFYNTYLSYNWHPDRNTYTNYYKEQEAGKRKVFIAEYENQVAGICTLVLEPIEGPLGGKGIPDGTGVWYQNKQLEQYAACCNDDDLLLFLSKKLKVSML